MAVVLGSTPRVVAVALILLGTLLLLAFGPRPSNTRDWSPDQAVLPTAEFEGDTVHVRNVRNTVYRTVDDYTVRHEDRSYDLGTLESVWFMVEPIASPGIAHTLVSFGFADGRYLAISVEIRKERGEAFHPVKGLLRQYELMYVVADEADVIRLRTDFRRDTVYLYPVRTTPERMRQMLVGMLARANTLADQPEFYNTLTSTCTTNLVRHVNEVAPRRVNPWSPKVLLPAYADELAHTLGLLDTELPIVEARQRHRIDEIARSLPDTADFSAGIRRHMP